MYDPRPENPIEPIPDDLTDASDYQIMRHLRSQTVWLAYFATQVNDLEQIEAEAETQYEVAKGNAYLADKKTVAESKALRDADPTVVAARQVWRDAKTKRKAMQITADNRERLAALLSREITRRSSREGPQRRADRNGGG